MSHLLNLIFFIYLISLRYKVTKMDIEQEDDSGYDTDPFADENDDSENSSEFSYTMTNPN